MKRRTVARGRWRMEVAAYDLEGSDCDDAVPPVVFDGTGAGDKAAAAGDAAVAVAASDEAEVLPASFDFSAQAAHQVARGGSCR